MTLFARTDNRPQTPLSGWQLSSPASKADPFPLYARLRRSAAACRVALPFRQTAWLVTRYDDVVTVLTDERFTKDQWNVLSPRQRARQRWVRKVLNPFQWSLLDLDPPDHTRQRAVANRAFLPRRIEALRDRVEALTNELLDRAQPQGGMDVIRDYALHVPTTIIAEMLGVPAADRERFHRWSDILIATGSSARGVARTMLAAWWFRRYLRRLIRARHNGPDGDFIGGLLQPDEAGHALCESEATSALFLLLVAGHETTINLIGNGVLALLQHPDQLDRLRRDPELIRPAVEEILRFTSPFEIGTKRFAKEDVPLDGAVIRRGDRVYPVLASANRDEQKFTEPDAFDITREPNRHLGFGLGHHFCLGAALARLEAQIAIGTLLDRFPEVRLNGPPDQLRWRRSMVMRGLESLPITWS